MKDIKINFTAISPTNIIASQLEYGDNRFKPIFWNKTYNILFNIHKKPGKYLFKIEYLPLDKEKIKKMNLISYKDTTRISDIIEILISWKNKVEKYPELIIKEKEELTKGLLGEAIIQNLNEISNLNSKIIAAKDADEQAFLSIDYFDKIENLMFLGAITPLDLENFVKNTNVLLTQYPEINKKIKKEKNPFTILRMLKKYVELEKDNLSSYELESIFEIFDDIIFDLDRKKSNKEDLLNLFYTFASLWRKLMENGWLDIYKYDEIEDKKDKLEEQVFKEKEKKENSLIWIERAYRKKRASEGYSMEEKAERNWESYGDDEIEDILNELASICEWNGPQIFKADLAKDLVIDLAMKYKREPGAFSSIFRLAFTDRPFMGINTNNDLNYTMKILIKRHKLGLDHYGKTNEWFIQRFEEELESGRGNEKSILRNIEILKKML